MYKSQTLYVIFTHEREKDTNKPRGYLKYFHTLKLGFYPYGVLFMKKTLLLFIISSFGFSTLACSLSKSFTRVYRCSNGNSYDLFFTLDTADENKYYVDTALICSVHTLPNQEKCRVEKSDEITFCMEEIKKFNPQLFTDKMPLRELLNIKISQARQATKEEKYQDELHSKLTALNSGLNNKKIESYIERRVKKHELTKEEHIKILSLYIQTLQNLKK